MELVAENGFIVSIPQGCKKELGRGSELAICDKTVSRHQILLELQERSKEVGSVDNDTSLCALSVKVLGVNPVCIVHIRQSIGRSDDQEMVLLKKGEMDTLSPGDKISLSLSLPMFLTVREGEGRKNIAGSKIIERLGSSVAVPMEEEMLANAVDSKQLAEDDLLGKWKDRKKKKETESCITQGGTARTDACENRCISADKDIATTNEEEAGIAQAVARRQRRALERRQQQEQKLKDGVPGPVKEAEDVSNVQHEAQELEDSFVKTESIDPVKEFGFLVEGSEFEQYKNLHKPGGRWVWPPAKLPAESISDEDDGDEQEKHTRSGRRKVRTEEDDEEWRGDDQEEVVVAVASTKKRKAGAKVNLRSHEPSSSKNRKTAVKKAAGGGGGMAKDRSEETEDEDEDEDEADGTLGGFIVSNEEEESSDEEEEEDPIDDDADDEEEESSDDEEEDENAQQQHKETKKKREEKPLCKYGKNCYRKNPEHLAQFRH